MRTKLFLIGLFCLVVPCGYLASQSPQSAQTQQDVLSQNAAHFSDYDFDKPYFNRPVAKDGTVDLSASMLNDYATLSPGSPRIAPEEEFQRTLNNFPVILIGVAVEQQSTLIVPIVNVELHESMEFAYPPSVSPSSPQCT